MSSSIVRNLEQRMRNWQNRAIQLHQLYQNEGRLPTLWEAEEADKMVLKLQKEIVKRKGWV